MVRVENEMSRAESSSNSLPSLHGVTGIFSGFLLLQHLGVGDDHPVLWWGMAPLLLALMGGSALLCFRSVWRRLSPRS